MGDAEKTINDDDIVEQQNDDNQIYDEIQNEQEIVGDSKQNDEQKELINDQVNDDAMNDDLESEQNENENELNQNEAVHDTVNDDLGSEENKIEHEKNEEPLNDHGINDAVKLEQDQNRIREEMVDAMNENVDDEDIHDVVVEDDHHSTTEINDGLLDYDQPSQHNQDLFEPNP